MKRIFLSEWGTNMCRGVCVCVRVCMCVKATEKASVADKIFPLLQPHPPRFSCLILAALLFYDKYHKML